MINVSEKSKCCGCAACVQCCPKQCISMREDEEGFLYPYYNAVECIDCGLCEKVCPVVNQVEEKEPLKVYAAKNKDLQKRELSSSGGLFVALAEKVIERGGVVFGVVFDENWEVHHVAATTIEELVPMMRSKYMQSRVESTFIEAESYLKEGREVMFTGTPCQIAGLRIFLRKSYDNLLTIDLICHGVPSPGVWRKYLQEELCKSARSAATGKNTVLNFSLKPVPVITGISFREKSRSGFDWQKFGFVVWGKSPVKGDKNSVLSSYTLWENPFMRGFLSNIYLRPSCYSCPAKSGKSQSDITIADFWGIENVLPRFYDKSGVGLAIVHSDKGLAAFNSCDFETNETELNAALVSNPSYRNSVIEPTKQRRRFFKGFKKGQDVIDLIAQVTCDSILTRIKRRLYNFCVGFHHQNNQ